MNFWGGPSGVPTNVRRSHTLVRVTMLTLIRDQRHFLRLFAWTNTAQGKALLGTITHGQIKALSQFAHNIIKFKITLNPSEKVLLKRNRCLLYILGDRTLGYHMKIEALCGKTKVCVYPSKNSIDAFGIGARIMEKLVLVTHDKYQRLLGAQSTNRSTPTALKRQTVHEPQLGERDMSKMKGPST